MNLIIYSQNWKEHSLRNDFKKFHRTTLFKVEKSELELICKILMGFGWGIEFV